MSIFNCFAVLAGRSTGTFGNAAYLAVVCGACVAASPVVATADVIIDDSTLGYYNSGIGSVLRDTSPFFTDDPILTINTAPDLSAAALQLGGWLNSPPVFSTAGATWSASAVAIPTGWDTGTETAVAYAFGSASLSLQNVVVTIGVDNGLLVWLDGTFVRGDTSPGASTFGEFVYSLGDLSSGTHYLQFLRSGAGAAENWQIEVTGTPIPAAGSGALLGLGGLLIARRRRR